MLYLYISFYSNIGGGISPYIVKACKLIDAISDEILIILLRISGDDNTMNIALGYIHSLTPYNHIPEILSTSDSSEKYVL